MENVNLRDYFAAAALTGLVSKSALYGTTQRRNIAPSNATENWVLISAEEKSKELREEVVRLAYEIADMMINEKLKD